VLDNGRAGELFPPGDSVALADLLADLLADEPRRRELAQQASRVVAAYDWPVVAQRVLEVYGSALDAFVEPHTSEVTPEP
jgi:phosphatidyl-myo-inositol alpha-mannosyltransferase